MRVFMSLPVSTSNHQKHKVKTFQIPNDKRLGVWTSKDSRDRAAQSPPNRTSIENGRIHEPTKVLRLKRYESMNRLRYFDREEIKERIKVL